MASDIDKQNFGDSARNGSEHEPQGKSSNHVFDGAGENIHYHSDSESVGSRSSKTRYINAAIYVEQVESSHSVTSLHTDSSCVDVTPHPHSSYRSNSTPFLTGRVSSDSSTSAKRKSCRLVDGDKCLGQEEEETPRYDRTYREDGPDTFRLSVASLSTTTTAKQERERNEAKKKEVFQQWLARKEQEKREKARREKMKLQPVPTTSPEEREESYRRWLERKRTQAERRRAEEVMRRFREAERAEQQRARNDGAKEEKLAEWIRKKEEDIKLMKTREERRAARAAIEAKRKRAEGERAYRDWLRTSKNKPLPVPLNQGQLSMRGSVSKMYINPIPWQTLT
ncbi:hypothetical protein MSG28_010146 [Choristoneura fumiferana]|uniref:Uncharacterized protein n=2 Tax=Choristoneura fumiferana TaxID=7141 RepID=A0ACC0KJG3_CHOFU|nr:hypothetical protein MSG28_010146 [Choristoneura fumiferana]